MKRLIYLVMFAILAGMVLAQPFDAEVIETDNSIRKNETSVSVIRITNTADYEKDFKVDFPNSDWIARTSPLGDYSFSLDAGEEKDLMMKMSPRSHLTPGPYAVPVVIKDNTDDGKLRTNIPIQLAERIVGEYLPVIRFDVGMDYEIDPREDVNIELDIENLNKRDLGRVNVTLESEIFNAQRQVELDPEEEKTESFSFDLEDTLHPMEDSIDISIKKTIGNESYDWSKSIKYKVIEYTGIHKDPRVDSGFLKDTNHIKVTNYGNVEKVYEVKHEVGSIERFFISEEPDASMLKAPDGRYLVWDVNLEPQEEKTLKVTTNFRVLAALLFIILLSVVLYFVFRSSILVKKEVANVAKSEGGISEIKIILYVKNRTGKTIDNVEIVEMVPHIANVGKEFQVGTIRPDKVMQNSRKGTLVKWNLNSLEAYEERIITYKLNSKLSILGGLTLPSTVIRYFKNNRKFKTHSNRLNLEV
ncbi:MAG: hypothetical protein ACQEP1_04795 [Nanobdellota archaeon]